MRAGCARQRWSATLAALRSPAGAEAALAALAHFQLLHRHHADRRERDDQQLRDPVAPRAIEALYAIGVQQQHAQFAAEARVDQTWRVDQRDPVAQCETRTRQDQTGVP